MGCQILKSLTSKSMPSVDVASMAMEVIRISGAGPVTGKDSSDIGESMSEEEMQELQNRVVESIQDYFDSYDWDRKFIDHFGE